VLVVVGGNIAEIVKKDEEPFGIIKAFVDLQEEDPKRERTLMSICTGALLLGKAGILPGLKATTHPDFISKFDEICHAASQRDLDEPTDILEDTRYVVNNLRFELGDVDDNPYVHRKSDAGDRRPSMARYVPLWPGVRCL
jgi:putative intracellular protease/amidase